MGAPHLQFQLTRGFSSSRNLSPDAIATDMKPVRQYTSTAEVEGPLPLHTHTHTRMRYAFLRYAFFYSVGQQISTAEIEVPLPLHTHR